MYKRDSAITTPPNGTIIWRYMDFTKFVDILDKRKLFFSSIEQLNDPFEGSFPKASIDFIKNNILSLFDKDFINNHTITEDIAIQAFSKSARLWRNWAHVCCWNIGKVESEALWRIYCSGREGIAIQSTIGRFKESIRKETQDIYIGKIHYIDYSKAHIPIKGSDQIKPLLYKRVSFQHEREVRAIAFPSHLIKVTENHIEIDTKKRGYYSAIDPNLLIEKVVISPLSEKWKKGLLQSVISKYNMDFVVEQSQISNKPLFLTRRHHHATT